MARDFRLQTVINCLKIVQKKEMDMGDLLAYIWLWIKPEKQKRVAANKLYDRRDIPFLRKLIIKLGKKDPIWFPRLFEPTTWGIRAWEYGILLSHLTFRGKSVLDVGSGSSRLPLYLSKSGARVTMLDMENPLEETLIRRDNNLRFVLGDMTNLEFKDNHFDRVLCISAIEHVDMMKDGFYSESEYISRATKAIKEMIRVTKKGGFFYLTTDFYLPKQKSDKWHGSAKEKIRGAFPWRCIELFLETIKSSGVNLTNNLDYDKSLVIDSSHSNYRGRFFTTVAFTGVKI